MLTAGGRKGGNDGKGGRDGTLEVGGGGSGGPAAGILLLGGSTADISDSQVVTSNAGNGTNPNRGIGGRNYGVVVDVTPRLLSDSNVTYQLGATGNNAPVVAEVGGP